MAAARDRGVQVAVALVDHRGDPIQLDSMDGAPTAGSFVAEAVAAAAATFQVPSGEVDPALVAVLPYRVLCVPGGLPVRDGDRVVAGVGVGGPPPELCHEITEAAIG